MTMAGRFITLEGGEGTGKSTQADLLFARLTEAGIRCVHTREPGGTTNAEVIRSLLVRGEADRWDAVSELCLINAARADHVRHVIKPNLEAGTWVICDRFIDSTLVYQGFVKGCSLELITAMHKLTTNALYPDLTIVLELDTDTALDRAVSRLSDEDRFESHDDLFHYKVADGFRVLSRKSRRHKLVDASGTIAEVHANIWQQVLSFLKLQNSLLSL